MIFKPNLAAAIILATIQLIAPCALPDEGKVTISVAVANNENSPIQILGFKLSQKRGEVHRAVLHNASSKHITRFWIEEVTGSFLGAANAKIDELVYSQRGESAVWPQEQTLSPDTYVDAHVNGISSHYLVLDAKSVHSNCLHVAALVMHVQFADGARWHVDREQQMQMWKDSIPAGSAGLCDSGSVTPSALERLQNAGYENPGSPTHADTETLQHYSFSCSLRKNGDHLAAICPM